MNGKLVQVGEKEKMGLVIIYKGTLIEAARLKQRKWRKQNRPVFGVNLDFLKRDRGKLEKDFGNWVQRYRVASLSFSMEPAECGRPGKDCPRLLNIIDYLGELHRNV